MRVLHAAKFYAPFRGGMETAVADLCDGTAFDWQVRVVAANDRAQTVHEHVGRVSVTRVAAHGRAASVAVCPTLPWHLWTASAECVVLHEPNPIAGAALWLRNPARRLIVWHHSDLLRPAWAPPTYGRIQRMLYRRADCVIVSSPALAAESALVQCARRVAVIPFGIDVEPYRRTDPVRTARVEQLRAASAGPRLLFVGRLVYYKGVDVLIDAARRWPGAVWIVGEGPLERELRARAEALGIADRVTFLGRLADDELQARYQAADVFVLPSVAKTEAFGIVQIEAMAAGLPVVSTRLPTGVPWVNQDGVTGVVVPPADVEALGEAFARLGADPALRRRLGEQAYHRATTAFARDRMVASFRDVVEAVVRTPERLDAVLAGASVV